MLAELGLTVPTVPDGRRPSAVVRGGVASTSPEKTTLTCDAAIEPRDDPAPRFVEELGRVDVVDFGGTSPGFVGGPSEGCRLLLLEMLLGLPDEDPGLSLPEGGLELLALAGVDVVV